MCAKSVARALLTTRCHLRIQVVLESAHGFADEGALIVMRAAKAVCGLFVFLIVSFGCAPEGQTERGGSEEQSLQRSADQVGHLLNSVAQGAVTWLQRHSGKLEVLTRWAYENPLHRFLTSWATTGQFGARISDDEYLQAKIDMNAYLQCNSPFRGFYPYIALSVDADRVMEFAVPIINATAAKLNLGQGHIQSAVGAVARATANLVDHVELVFF